MIARSYDENNAAFHKYGARGIGVCDEWRTSYLVFETWALQSGYKEGLYLDRKDNYKGYAPCNCRFITQALSNRNRRPLKGNTSGVSGVSLDRRNNKYRVSFRADGKQVWLGYHEKLEDAIKIRKDMELKYWNE